MEKKIMYRGELMDNIATEFGKKFRGDLVPIFNSNTEHGTPIFLIKIENGIPTPYCTIVEHFFNGKDPFDLCYFFNELDKNKEMFFVVNDEDETEVYTMIRNNMI